MEEFRDKLLTQLSEINQRKNQIREELKMSRELYEAYRRYKHRKTTYFLSTVGVGLAAAVILGFIFLPSLTPMNSELEYKQYYQPFNFQTDSRGSRHPDPLTLSADLYMEGHYNEAIQKADSILKAKPDEIKAYLLKGLAKLDKGDYQEAKSALTAVISSGGSLGTTAQWYLSLIDLKGKRYQAAAEGFKKVKADPNSPYSKRAANLFHRLRYRKNK